MSDDGSDREPEVLVVGAGFGGLSVADRLRGTQANVTLIDRNNYHKFQPLLYQVATAGLNPEHIAQSVRSIYREAPNISFRRQTVENIDQSKEELICSNGTRIRYDYLVMAAGAVTEYFGVEGAKAHSYTIKNIDEAVRLRSHILSTFEEVANRPNAIHEGELNFVLVGGGLTGVETAGALKELFKHVLRKEYPKSLVNKARVIVLEMQENILPPYDDDMREYALEALQRRGVDVRLNTEVDRVYDDRVKLKDGSTIRTETLIWTAGIRANPLADTLGADQTPGGRVSVRPDLRLPDNEKIFVIGDMANAKRENGTPLPQMAPVAIQEAKHTADQILKLENNQSTEAFHYDDPGTMATIGRHDAIVELPNLKITGYVAWVCWVFLHIVKLIGFRNKIAVFLSWIYNYLTYESSSRIILSDPHKQNDG